jgi:hypothetical protein
MFADFAVPRARGVWKLDVLTADGKALDRTRSIRTINRLAMKLAGADSTTAQAL